METVTHSMLLTTVFHLYTLHIRDLLWVSICIQISTWVLKFYKHQWELNS